MSWNLDLNKLGIFVDIAVDCNSLNAHSLGSSDDSTCDFSSVGDKDFFNETHIVDNKKI